MPTRQRGRSPRSVPVAAGYPISVARLHTDAVLNDQIRHRDQRKHTTSITPPIASRLKFAESPTVVKKTISSVSRAERSNVTSKPATMNQEGRSPRKR